MIIEIGLIFLMGLFGWMAGGRPKHWINKIAAPSIGICIGLIAGIHDWWLILFALAGWLGEKPGVGHPIGYIVDRRWITDPKDWNHKENKLYELEKWEPESLRYKPYKALALRGAINGVIYAPLAFVTPGVLFLIPLYAFAWPVSMLHEDWEFSEIGRQVIAGGLFYIICLL